MAQLAKTLLRSYPWATTPFIVSAPMRVMAGPALALATSRAGGLGFLGPTVKTSDMVADLEKVSATLKSSATSPSSSSNSPSSFNDISSKTSSLPVGVGFQLWSDDLETAASAIHKFKPCAAWLFAPREGQRDIEEWSRRIRSASPDIQIWVQIGTITEAKLLAQSSEPPDVIVVQGSEAGGHGRAKDGLGLMALFPEVADVLAETHIPLFAAGGIADGRGAAAALCLGASGIVMGTRFLASTEARISKGYQNEIVRASNGAVTTTRTLLYNHLRGTMGWPEPYSPRTIINRSFIEHQAGRSFDELKELHDQATKAGDSGWGPEGRLATYAGASIGLIHEVKDAASIVHDTRKDIQKRLAFSEQFRL
jgi:nitronate monooxygenase